MITPIQLITALRESDFYIKAIYTQGSCYRFHLFLKELWPAAIPYINAKKDHIATRIENSLYDINGELDENGEDWQPLENKTQIKLCELWSFRRNNMIQIDECQACEEPLIYDDKKAGFI